MLLFIFQGLTLKHKAWTESLWDNNSRERSTNTILTEYTWNVFVGLCCSIACTTRARSLMADWAILFHCTDGFKHFLFQYQKKLVSIIFIISRCNPMLLWLQMWHYIIFFFLVIMIWRRKIILIIYIYSLTIERINNIVKVR